MDVQGTSDGRLRLGGAMPYLIALIVAIALVVLLFQYWFITLPIALAIVVAIYAPGVVRHIRMRRYFASEAFKACKAHAAAVVREHNEVAKYAAEIRRKGTFELGASSSGAHSHLAKFENTSHYNYRRDRNVADYAAANVHNCSLQVVRNAKSAPLKYLAKYFDIKPTEERLTQVEELGESVARLEDAVANLKKREDSIASDINPPPFILTHYRDEFMSQVGVKLDPIPIPYPQYRFQYVSAGGNSAQQTVIELNTQTIDELVETLSTKIRFTKTAAGQRALMTARLRNFIKHRDKHRCKSCSASVAAEPNLLLEVDHIIPISRGGLSTVDNLQTLCWRCNRSKSNKILAR